MRRSGCVFVSRCLRDATRPFARVAQKRISASRDAQEDLNSKIRFMEEAEKERILQERRRVEALQREQELTKKLTDAGITIKDVRSVLAPRRWALPCTRPLVCDGRAAFSARK